MLWQVPGAEEGPGDGGVAEAGAVDSEAPPEASAEGAEAEDALGDVVRRS